MVRLKDSGMSFKAIGEVWGISLQRIHQITGSGLRKAPSKPPPQTAKCAHCNTDYVRHPCDEKRRVKFCSMECRAAAHSVERNCKNCGVLFRIAKGATVSKMPKSYGAKVGFFCCLECWYDYLAGVKRTGHKLGHHRYKVEPGQTRAPRG